MRCRHPHHRAAVDPRWQAGDDHRAAAARQHRPNAVLAGQEHAGEVSVDDALPVLERQLMHPAIPLEPRLDACHADQHVKTAPGGDNCRDRPGDLVLAGDIGGQRQALATFGPDQAGGLLHHVRPATHQPDLGGLLRQADRPPSGRSRCRHRLPGRVCQSDAAVVGANLNGATRCMPLLTSCFPATRRISASSPHRLARAFG